MESGKIINWLRNQGTKVSMEEDIVEVEADKAVVILPSPEDGILHIVIEASDQMIEVGTVIGYILSPAETPPSD
jgi:2-oxoglutarate dehydrogenase E2 component (dihydrolipoamide succinyltransferase)